MRKLATLRRISEIAPIPEADAIEVATVDGWKLVVKKGEFSVGQLALYLEIDSWVPHELAPFLSKGQEPRVYEGVPGQKLRTVKLRGQISQGLLLPISTSVLIEAVVQMAQGTTPTSTDPVLLKMAHDMLSGVNGDLSQLDLTELLGIKKWEPEIPAQLAGLVKGAFPSFITKTDQERCQNLITEIFVDNVDAQYEVTTKLDGSSCTIYIRDGELGVCSRNLELKICDENAGNSLVRALYDNLLNVSLPLLGRNIALQGEIMGPGVQGNREQLKTTQFFVFDIYDIDTGRYLTPVQRHALVEVLRQTCPTLQHVPIIAHSANLLDTLGITNVEQLLKFAEGPSLHHAVREGLVFKRIDGGFSFKAISNLFLAKEKD